LRISRRTIRQHRGCDQCRDAQNDQDRDHLEDDGIDFPLSCRSSGSFRPV
jgi:hypothetical protein